ncbi:MAG TPA: hypothetical protein VFU98_06545 [Microlunatus sp.]|nr:hypothetical protein [Microlunatus sp.]
MGTTGVIFGAIAIAWLAYLVPHFVRKRDDEPTADSDDPAERFAGSMRVVQHGTAPLLDQDLSEIGTYEVSTPLTRRAAVADLRRLERVAALRRRRVLLALLAVLSLVVGLAGAELIPWWSTAIPGGVLVLFFAISRFSVIGMRRSLDARYADIQRGGDEVTVFINRSQLTSKAPAAVAEDAPAEEKPSAGALWDPVPITVPTYVSKPLAPRTVRTIDLSGPAVTSAAPVQEPVTADPQPASAASAAEVVVEESGGDERRAASA